MVIFLGLLVLVSVAACIVLWFIHAFTAAKNNKLSAENDLLRPFAKVKDAMSESRRLMDEAVARSARILTEAQANAERLEADAQTKAEAIAGEAIKIAGRKKELQAVVKALENRARGYGDEYIKPSASLLDELAAEFGHKEAGQKLAAARKATAAIIKSVEAAKCEYVEPDRRQTAERFVVFAFNGLVDSTLSEVKHDNVGKLEQEINDAFVLCNELGRAFRNAAITPAYLTARLAELRWAATAQELKRRAQEEQRQLREQIREEQKAQREIERALKKSADDEAKIKEQLAKAQLQAQSAATQAERDRLAVQLVQLQAKLAEAEASSQRALSMAQQTRKGHVYVISNVGSLGSGVLKIGCTRRLDPLDRVWELGDASVPFDFDVHAMISTDDAPNLERELHRLFAVNQINKCNPRKEFFRLDLAIVRKELETAGVPVAWTMEAEAREYKETQAIEAKLDADPELRRRWIAGQRDLEFMPKSDPREVEEALNE